MVRAKLVRAEPSCVDTGVTTAYRSSIDRLLCSLAERFLAGQSISEQWGLLLAFRTVLLADLRNLPGRAIIVLIRLCLSVKYSLARRFLKLKELE